MTIPAVEIVSFAATIIAVAGVILNNRRQRACFVVWMFSNALSFGIHYHANLGGMAGRDVVFFLLAVQGWRAWARVDNHKDTKTRSQDGEKA